MRLVRHRLGPILRDAFPQRKRITVLLDGEKLMHTKEGKAELKAFGCRALPGWPATSPDLNPQENVWAWAEDELRRKERASDTLDTFTRRVLDVTKRYPSGSKLIPSMAKRVAKCIQKRGAPIGT